MLKAIPAVALLVTAACHTLGRVGPNALTSSPRPERVWVTRADSSTVVLQDPVLRGDTITGLLYGEPERVQLSDARAIRVRRSDPVRTAVVVAISGVAAGEWLWRMEHRDDVGDAQVCTNGVLDPGVIPGSQYIPCCQITGATPC